MEPDAIDLSERVAPNMRREVDRMNRLVRDLLALTRLDASPAEPSSLDDVDLGQIADDMVSAASAAAGSRQLELIRSSEEGPYVRGDPYSIERVLENLLQNAIQYTPEDGHIEVKVEGRGDMASMSVTDDGQGIPADHLARVFDRFYRVDPSRARANGNAGLGLAITKAIVTQHGGTISVQSRPGQGSSFTVLLPTIEYKYA
jgi:signal transduction histidine kinase